MLKKFFILSALLISPAIGEVPKKATTKQIYLSPRACAKARKADANADCSVVDFKLDTLFSDADTDKTLYFLVSEVPVQSVDITPVASGSSTFPTTWGARGVSRETGAIAGTIPPEIQDDIVIITDTSIGFSSTTAKRVSKISLGETDYAVPILARNRILGARTVIFQAITGGLPATGDWDDLVVHFTDGTKQPAGGTARQKRLPYTSLPSGGSGGGNVYLGQSEVAVFQIPQLASTRLTVSTANTPVFYNVPSITGAGLTGKLTQSTVSNIARVTVGQAGYINLVWEDELEIITSTAGGSGNSGEFVFVITQYNSAGTDLRSWVYEHAIEDPITNSSRFPFSQVTGLTPVSQGDYFTFNFAFNSSRASDNVNFSLPADNAGLDERIEFFYFPVSSVVPTGPRGPPGPAGPQGPEANQWWYISSTRSLNTLGRPDSITGEGNSVNWTYLRLYSEDDQPTAGTNFSGAGGPSGVTLKYFGVTTEWYSGETGSYNGGVTQFLHDWVSGIIYRRQATSAGTAGTVIDYPTEITSSWQTVYTPATGGGTADTAAQIKTKLETLRAGDRLSATAIKDLPDGKVTALDTTPTDLSPYSHGQVLPVNTPTPGKWIEVTGADSGERHIFKLAGAADPSNANNWGYSSTGDIYGELRTWDGGQVVTDSGIVRLELQDRSTDTGVLLLSKSKVTYADAPSDIYVLFYQNNTLGSSNYIIDNIRFRKQADNQAHDYTTYVVNSTDAGDVTAVLEDRQYLTGFGLFTAVNVPQTDYTSNAFNLHSAKAVMDFGAEPAVWARAGSVIPSVPAYFNDVVGSETYSVTQADRVDSLTVTGNISDRSAGGMVFLDSDTVLIFGGYNGSSYLNDFYKAEVSGNSVTVSSLSVTGSISRRNFNGMVSLDSDTVLIFGGYNGSSYLNDFYKAEVSGNSVTVSSLSVTGSISRRTINCMVSLDSDTALIVGGYDGSIRLNDFYKAEVSGNSVTVSSLSVTGSLSDCDSMVSLDSDTVLIFGSNIQSGQSLFKADISGNSVTITDLNKTGNFGVTFGEMVSLDSSAFLINFNNSRLFKADISDNNFTVSRLAELDQQIPFVNSPKMVSLDSDTVLIFGGYTVDDNDDDIYINDFHKVTVDATSERTRGILLAEPSTPRRVDALPADADSKDGENIFLNSDYSVTSGVNITPQSFAGTELDNVTNPDAQAGIGARGWYNKQDAGFDFGEIHPALPDDFVVVSDSRVYVKDDTQTNLAKLLLGTTEYALTRVNQTTTRLINQPGDTSQVFVDYYTITGGLPAGDWDDLRFETTTAGTFIPASATVTKGQYTFLNADWGRSGFYAPTAQPDKDFLFAVEEERAGTRQDASIAFVASGSTFTKSDPFPGVLRITYNNLSTDADTYQRYTVFVPLAGFEDSKAPSVLRVKGVQYSLSYFETDAGQAVYRTALVKSTERLSAAGTLTGMNVGFLDGSWAGQVGLTRVRRTVDKRTLQAVANAVTGVHSVPTNPHEGQRIEMLNDQTIQGGAVLTAQESSGSTQAGVSITGLFTGYEIDSRYDNGSAGGDLGSLDPINANFAGLVSFSNARASGSEANKTMFISANGNTYAPRSVWINGVKYAVGSAVNRDFFPLTGLDGSFLKPGKKYYVNVENASGTKLFEDVVLKAGEVYLWTGIQWVKTLRGLQESEVDARINAKIPQQFRQDADTSSTGTNGKYIQPKGFWCGPENEYTALTKKAGYLYIRGATGSGACN